VLVCSSRFRFERLTRAALFVVLLAASFASAQPFSGARYLIIAPDSFVLALQPLAAWKTQKGVPARIVTLDQTGDTPEQVQAFIRNAWMTWVPKPEYVLLACSPAYLPGFTWDNDCYYGNMTGDYRMEVAVGRLPAEDAYECRTMVAKILAYEQPPPSPDTSWYLAGTTCVSEDMPGNPDLYYLPDSRFARELWQDAGYLKTESLYNLAGDSTPQLIAALNEGRSFITYRGPAGAYWYYPFAIAPDTDWVNRRRTPILVGATCETVTLFPYRTMFGDASVRFGSPEALGGAVAYLGTTRSWYSVSQYRSAVYRGLFTGLFTEDNARLGPALERGRLHMDSLFGDSAFYEEWTLLGDPELNVWTAVPHAARVSHPGGINPGAQSFPVLVLSGGLPVSGALVCLVMDSTVYATEITDAAGSAELAIAPVHPGLMTIVATGRNLRPYQGRCVVFGSGASSLVYLKHEVNDSPPGGNADGLVGQGETVRLPVWLVNYGDTAAPAVSATLSAGDTLVSVLDSVQSFGRVSGHDSAETREQGYHITVAPACPDAHTIGFSLACRDSFGVVQQTGFEVMVSAPVLNYDAVQCNDSTGNGNHRLDPGETAQLIVTLRNAGHGPAESTRATLHSWDSRLTVLDSVGFFGIVPAGATGRNLADCFLVSAALMLPETEIPCLLTVSCRSYETSLPFSLRVGEVSTSDPMSDGPRTPPLYWAYDESDSVYSEHPEFEWVELRGSGTHITYRRDSSAVINLPFTFNYYGQPYTQVSVCNNGFIVPGASSYCVRDNVRLPAGAGVPMLAANWDAIAPILGNGVWYQHDPAEHRFIVEWDSVAYRAASNKFEKFEIIIYDSTVRAHWGQSVFEFRYLTANLYTSSTVGIQDQSLDIGMSALYSGHYDRAAAHIAPERTIRFTTNAPFSALNEMKQLVGRGRPKLSLVVQPNPMSSSALVRFSQPDPARVSVEIYDASGRLVSVLANRFQPAGTGRLAWTGLDRSGRRLPQGIYICRARLGTSALSVPVVLLH